MRAQSRVLTVTILRRFTSVALLLGTLAAAARGQEPVDVGKLLAILDANAQRTFTCRHSLIEVLAEDPTRDEEVRRRLEAAGTTAPADANFVADYVYTACGSRLVGSFVVHHNALHGEGSAWVSLSDGERTLWVTGNEATVRLYREYTIGGAGGLVTFFLGGWGADHAASRMRQGLDDGTLAARRDDDGAITAAMHFRAGTNDTKVTWELGFDPESRRVESVRKFNPDFPDSPKGGFWVATFDPTNGLPRTGWSVAHWGRYTRKRYLRFHRFTYEDLALAPDDVLRLAADALAGKPDELQGISPTAYAHHLDAEIARVASATVDTFLRRPHALSPRLRPEELVWPSLADFRGGRERGDRIDPEVPHTRRAHAALAFLVGYHARTAAPLLDAFEKAPSVDLSFADVSRLAADLGVPLQTVELDAGAASLLTEPFLLSLPAIADTPAHLAVGLPRGTSGVRVWRPPGSASDGVAFATTRCLVSLADLARLRATQAAQREAEQTAKVKSLALAIIATGAGIALAYLLWRRRLRGALVSAGTLAVALGWWFWLSGSTAPSASPATPSKVEAPTVESPTVTAVPPPVLESPPPPRIALPARNPGDLAGVAVDAETHAALAGVEVELAVDLAAPIFAPATKTDADGAFAIAAGAWGDPCSLRFARDGYRTRTVPYSGEGDLGVVRLTPAPPLRVRVLRADDGTPLQDLAVQVGPTGHRLLFVETQKTDAAGEAVFVRAPDDGMRVRVQLAGGTFSVTLPPRPGPEPVLILVPGERRVQVSVVDAQTRAPLSGTRLQRPDGAALTCDDAGTCTVPLLAGTSTVVRLEAAGYFASETLIDARATAVVVEARPTCIIRGRVDTDVAVRLERTASSGPALATRLPDGALAADGTFEWRDVPALSHLGVRALVDGAIVAASASLRTPAGGETATLPPMRIEPLARVRVQVEGAGQGPVGLVFTVRDAQRRTKVSHGAWYGSRGEHLLTIPDGSLLLAARQADGGSARTELEVPPRGDLRVVLRLEPGVDVAGALRLDGNAAAPACEISCQPLEPGLPARTVWTDADGRFVLRSLPPGRYHVSAHASHCSPPGYAYESATRELGPGDRAFELSVPRLGGEIVGRITGVPPERTAHGIVHAIDRDGRRHPGRLEPDLRFTIPVPARGVFRIEAVSLLVPDGGRRWTASLDQVAPGADVSLPAVVR